jgi:hypothetical protein
MRAEKRSERFVQFYPLSPKFSYITFDKQGLIYPISTFLFQGSTEQHERKFQS